MTWPFPPDNRADMASRDGTDLVGDLLQEATDALRTRSDSPRLDAEVLLAHLLERPRSHLHAWPRRPVPPAIATGFRRLVQRRARGEPVAYLTGRKEFWSLTLRVNRHTLIPRPETECLVERALALLPADAACRIADLGTGSGAIALALAKERPRWRLTACDISRRALVTARANARHLGLSRQVDFRLSDWCRCLDTAERFDLIAANPPYVRAGDPRLAEDVLRFEPATALIAGTEGLEALRAIADQARHFLRPGGWLLLEHGDDQQACVQRLLAKEGYEDIEGWQDHAGRPRLVQARRI